MWTKIMHHFTYKRLTRARNYIRETYSMPTSLSDIAREANLSRYHFLRIYKETFQETPHKFLVRLRIDRAKLLLAKGQHNVTETCFEVGFSSLGSFSTLFSKHVGLSPSEYRRYVRSSIVVPRNIQTVLIPSCFLSMLFGKE